MATEAPAESVAPGNRNGEWRNCPFCPTRTWVRPSELDGWRACSRVCAARGRRGLKAWNPLQARCFERMAELHLTFSAFAAHLGIPDSGLRRWFRTKGSTTRRAVLEAIAVGLEIPVDQAINEAGGQTDDDRRRVHGRAQAEKHFVPRTSEDRKKAWRKVPPDKRGKRWTAEQRENVAAGRARTRADERRNVAANKEQRSDRGRARTSLLGRLRHHPNPTRKERDQWEFEAAGKFNLTKGVIHAIWRPYLIERGLLGGGGLQPTKGEARHSLIENLQAAWPRKANGSLGDGFWNHAAEVVSKGEKIIPPLTGEGLRQGHLYHLNHCRCPSGPD
jgi:hypothetical protein